MATYQIQMRDGKYVVAIFNNAGEITDISPPFDEKAAAKALRDDAEKAGVARLADIPHEKPPEPAAASTATPMKAKAAEEPAPKHGAMAHKPKPAAESHYKPSTRKSHR